MIPINVGDSILVSFGPHMAPTNPQLGTGTTTATVATVDNVRRQLTVTHATGALSGKTGTLHLDHARALTDTFAPRPVGPTWQ